MERSYSIAGLRSSAIGERRDCLSKLPNNRDGWGKHHCRMQSEKHRGIIGNFQISTVQRHGTRCTNIDLESRGWYNDRHKKIEHDSAEHGHKCIIRVEMYKGDIIWEKRLSLRISQKTSVGYDHHRHTRNHARQYVNKRWHLMKSSMTRSHLAAKTMVGTVRSEME